MNNENLVAAADTYPTSISSLLLPTASLNISSAVSSLNRNSLSISNRLSSIYHDSLFVRQITERYRLPLVANERCGSWYIPPDIRAGSAYFKSTDGHQGQWAFSTRRLNLQILDIVEKHGGCIIVDSTRRGKSMPDALSKTVPIWCAVMNSLLLGENYGSTGIYTPEDVVSPSEHSQIQARLDSFVEEAKRLHLNLQARTQALQKPLRPIFTIPTSTPSSPISREAPYNPIICLTASSPASNFPQKPSPTYIQGAADDSESWSYGLTPPLFWAHKDQLLSTSEDDLPRLIQSLLLTAAPSPGPFHSTIPPATLIQPTQSLYIAPLSSAVLNTTTSSSWDAIIVCAPTNPFESKEEPPPPQQQPPPVTSPGKKKQPQKTPQILHLRCPNGKLGSRALRTQWHLVLSFITKTLLLLLRTDYSSSSSSSPSHPPLKKKKILCTCPTGTDLSVGVALVILCRFFDEEGGVLGLRLRGGGGGGGGVEEEGLSKEVVVVDKTFIRRRLAWVTGSTRGEANPSRETLQAVSVCLM